MAEVGKAIKNGDAMCNIRQFPALKGLETYAQDQLRVPSKLPPARVPSAVAQLPP